MKSANERMRLRVDGLQRKVDALVDAGFWVTSKERARLEAQVEREIRSTCEICEATYRTAESFIEGEPVILCAACRWDWRYERWQNIAPELYRGFLVGVAVSYLIVKLISWLAWGIPHLP